MNCVLYARVSTDKQAEKELSIPAQLQAMREYARTHGWLVAEEFLEPGVSAKTAERPALQRLLARCRHATERPQVVLVHKVDRLARNVYDHATIKALLKQHGIRLASVVENIEDTVSGQLVENIMASIAQFYSANLSEEVKKGMRQRAKRGGWNHRPPRGYVLIRNGDQRAIEVHPKEGPLMRRAFELYASGWYTMKQLAKRLALEGLQSATGNPISHAHLRRLLTNSFFSGLVRWGRDEYPGSHPALVPPELFAKVQQVIKRVSRGDGVTVKIEGFPLRGVALCATCRGKMTAERHGRHKYYRCSRQTYRRELCNARFCNAERADEHLERICRQLRLSPDHAQEIQEAAERIIGERTIRARERFEQRDEKAAELHRREMQLSAAFAAGHLAPAAYQSQLAAVRAKRKELIDVPLDPLDFQNQLMERVGRTLQLASSFWDLYEPLNDTMRREMVRAVFSTVILDHQGIAGYVLRPPFDTLLGSKDSSADPVGMASQILQAAA
jgi:DNA invertase Pin-like site-specific DNA recombinase